MKDKLTIFRETEIQDKEELLICLRDLFVHRGRKGGEDPRSGSWGRSDPFRLRSREGWRARGGCRGS